MIETLRANEVAIGGLVVNRVFPELDEGAFLAARVDQQRDHLGEIARRFEDLPVTTILHEPRDVTTLDQLERIASQLEDLVAAP